jgi:hypothetical protein
MILTYSAKSINDFYYNLLRNIERESEREREREKDS